MRAKFRKSMEHPEALVPDQPTPLSFEMPDVLHTFLPGHRMLVQVQGSWFPLVDRNPQTFVDIYRARPEDFRIATQRAHRGSRIVVSAIGPMP
jgi:predicted acyl esterase